MRVLLIFTLLLLLATLSMCLISIGLPYWLFRDNPYEVFQGLWERCSKQTGSKECNIIKLAPEFLDAVRVMLIFGMCCYLIATICTCVYLFCKREKTSLINAALILCVFGGILCMIAIAVYGAKYDYMLDAKFSRLHAAFGLAVCSSIGGFVCTIFFCMAKARGEVD